MINFNNVRKIVLFGGSPILFKFVAFLNKETDFEILVYSAKRHLDDEFEGCKLRDYLLGLGVVFREVDNLDSCNQLQDDITYGSLGIAFGAAWIFEKPIIDMFQKQHMLDFMGIDLPRYRGGAHYTWMILHENRTGSSNLQIIEGGADTFHKGKLIKHRKYSLPNKLKIPSDFFNYIIKEEMQFLKDFISEIKEKKSFELVSLEEKNSSYFPFLNTVHHGLIDWGWSGKEIYLFINAFDKPYVGASTFCGENQYFLGCCCLVESDEIFHPFTSGIVIRKDNSFLYVAVVGYILRVGCISDQKGVSAFDSIHVGDRFYTPLFELDKARCFNAVYGSKGLVGEVKCQK